MSATTSPALSVRGVVSQGIGFGSVPLEHAETSAIKPSAIVLNAPRLRGANMALLLGLGIHARRLRRASRKRREAAVKPPATHATGGMACTRISVERSRFELLNQIYRSEE